MAGQNRHGGPENPLNEITFEKLEKTKKSRNLKFLYQKDTGKIAEINKEILERNIPKSERAISLINNLPHLAAEAYCDIFLKHPDSDFLRNDKKKLELMIHAIGISCVNTLADTDKLILTKREEFKNIERLLNEFHCKMSEKSDMERAAENYSKLPGDFPKPQHAASEAAERLAMYERVKDLHENIENVLEKDFKDLPNGEHGKSTKPEEGAPDANKPTEGDNIKYKDIADAILKISESKEIFAKIKQLQIQADKLEKEDINLAKADFKLAKKRAQLAKENVKTAKSELDKARRDFQEEKMYQAELSEIDENKLKALEDVYKGKVSKYKELRKDAEKYQEEADHKEKHAKQLEEEFEKAKGERKNLEKYKVDEQNTEEIKKVILKFSNVENAEKFTKLIKEYKEGYINEDGSIKDPNKESEREEANKAIETNIDEIKKAILQKYQTKTQNYKEESGKAGERAKAAGENVEKAKKRVKAAGERSREAGKRFKVGKNIGSNKHINELKYTEKALKYAKDIQQMEEKIAIHADSIKAIETSLKDKLTEIDGKIKKMQKIMEKVDVPSDEQKKELEKLAKEIEDAEKVKNNIIDSKERASKSEQELLEKVKSRLKEEKEALKNEGEVSKKEGLNRLAGEDLKQFRNPRTADALSLASALKRTAIYMEQDAIADRDQALESLQKIKDAFVAEDQEQLKGSGEAHIPIYIPNLRFSINGVVMDIREVIKWTRNASTGETTIELKPDLGDTIEEVVTRVSDKENLIQNEKSTKRLGQWVKTVGDWEGYLEIPGLRANEERKEGIARIINKKELQKVIEEGKIKAMENMLTYDIKQERNRYYSFSEDSRYKEYKLVKDAINNIREDDIKNELDNPTQEDRERAEKIKDRSRGDTDEEKYKNALKYSIAQRLAIENLAVEKINKDIEKDDEKKKAIDKKIQKYVDENKHRFTKHEQKYDMQSARQWGFRENQTTAGGTLDFFFYGEVKPSRVIKHESTQPFTAEEIRNGFMINVKRHTLMLPNGHEISLDAFDWVKSECDEKNGITLIRKGPAKLSHLNLSMVASLADHHPELSRTIKDVKRERRNCLDTRIEWLESAIRSNNSKKINETLKIIREAEDEELKHSAKATRELGNPPDDIHDMANFRKKKRVERNGIDINTVRYSCDSTNHIPKAVQDYEHRIKNIILQLDTQKKQNFKEKNKEINENNADDYLDRKIPFTLLIDPQKGEGQGEENTKNKEANGFDLMREYNKYKGKKDIADDKNVADYLEKIAMEFRTNPNIPAYSTNQWYLERAHEAVNQGNFFGKTEKDGRYSEGAIDYIRKLKPGHLPLDPQENPLAGLRQTYENYWVTSLHKAVYEAKEARSEKVVADALTAAKDMQSKIQANLENAQKALDPKTSPEEVKKLLYEMRIIKDILKPETSEELSKVDKGAKIETGPGWKFDPKEFIKKSPAELNQQAIEEMVKSYNEAIDEHLKHINSIDDIEAQKQLRADLGVTTREIAKDTTQRAEKYIEIQNQWKRLEFLNERMGIALWQDTVRMWFLMMLQNSLQGGNQAFQYLFNEMFKVATEKL